MRQRLTLLMLLVLTGALVAAPQYDRKTSLHVICARPVDAGPASSHARNHWFVAVSDALVRFRLEPIRAMGVESFNELSKRVPEVKDLEANIPESRYHSPARESGGALVVNQKFEIDNNQKTIQYYLEAIDIRNHSIAASAEASIPFDNLARSLDSLLAVFTTRLGVEQTAEVVRSFEIPVLSNNHKNIKQLGELIKADRFSQDRNDAELVRDYEKMIAKDPFLLLGNYFCGQAAFRAKQYSVAARYIKELLDLTPIHTNLYIGLAQSYRLGGRYQDALAVAMGCEQMRLRTPPFLLEKALALQALGQRASALSVHHQILSLDPKHPASLLFLAQQKNDEGRAKEALPYTDRLLKFYPENGLGYYERGRSYVLLNRFGEGLQAFQSAAKILPDNPEVMVALADILMRKGAPRDAAEVYRKSVALAPKMLEFHLKLAKALEFAGQADEALQHLRGIEKQFTDKPALLKSMGLLEIAGKQSNQAQSHLESYLLAHPGDAEALMALGHLYEDAHNNEQALGAFQKALPTAGDKTLCKLAIARLYLAKGDAKSSMPYLKEVLSEKPIRSAYRLMGDALSSSGMAPEALAHYVKERELHGDDPYVQERIAQLHFQRGIMPLAKQDFIKLSRIAPSNATAFYYLALIYLREGEKETAQGYLRSAEKNGAASAAVYLLLGDAFAAAGEFQNAISAYEKCLKIEPQREEALLNLATAQINADHDSASAETFLKIYALDNAKYSEYLANAGHTFRKLKLYARAREAYDRFLQKGYNSFAVNAGLAHVVYRDRNYERVITLLKNASGKWSTDEEVLMMMAHSYCSTNQHGAALPHLRAVLKQNPKQQFAVELAALSYEKNGDIGQAIRMHKEYLQFESAEKHRDFAFHLGELYERQNDREAAASQYSENVRSYPDDLRNHNRLASLYVAAGDLTRAQEVLEAAVEFPQVSPNLLKMLAQTYSARDNKEGAAKLYKVYLSRSAKDSSVWKELGTLYFSQKMYADAVNPLARATELMPSNFECFHMLGISLVESGNLSKAVAPLSRAASLDKSSAPVLELLAKCYRALKETNSLTATLQSWVSLDARRFDIRIELGTMLIADHKLPDAVSVLTQAILLNPSDERPHRLLAQAYEQQGNDSLQLHHLLVAQRFGPQNWETQFQIARYHLSKDKTLEAEPYLKRAIELNPRNGRAHYEYGAILQERGEFEKAYTELETAAESEPNNALFLAAFAHCATMVNQPEKAMEHISVALGKDPSNARVLYWAGRVYRNLGRTETAKQSLRDAISKDVNYAPAYEALGDMHCAGAEFREASRLYFLAWEKGGYKETRALRLGKSLAYAGKHNEAVPFFETILTKNPNHSEALYRLTDSYCELGDIKKAKKYANSFPPGNKHVWMQLAQGRVYEAEGKDDAAWIAYNVAKRFSADNALVDAGQGRMYLKKGLFDSAIVCFTSSLTRDSVNMQTIIDLGKSYQALGQNETASEYFGEVAQKFPEHPEVHMMIAKLESEENNHLNAIRALKKGIEYNPKNPTLYFMLGREYEVTDHFEDAIEAYHSALRRSKGQHVEALRYIGNIYYSKLVNDKKAREFYKKYVKAGGKSDEVDEVIRKLEGI